MSLSRFGDRLLDLLVHRGDAGACVPNNGDYCYRTTTTCGGHVLWENEYRGIVQCGGSCANQTLISRSPIGKC